MGPHHHHHHHHQEAHLPQAHHHQAHHHQAHHHHHHHHHQAHHHHEARHHQAHHQHPQDDQEMLVAIMTVQHLCLGQVTKQFKGQAASTECGCLTIYLADGHTMSNAP